MFAQHFRYLFRKNPFSAKLTVRAGFELEARAAGSISSSSASSDLEQVGRVGLQTIQGHITTPSSEDSVAGLLFFLEISRTQFEIQDLLLCYIFLYIYI